MLVLSRRLHETIRVGDDMQIVIFGIHEKGISLGIDAPKHIPVYRKEIYKLIKSKKKDVSVGIS